MPKAGDKVKKYRVESGDMKVVVLAGEDATPKEIAMLALERSTPKTLGILIEISGGKYTGDQVSYVLSENICKLLGRWG